MQLKGVGWKRVIFFFALLIGEILTEEIHPEEPCSRIGGICTRKDDCPSNIPKKNLGLCPQQQSQGVECCSQIANSERRCRKLGGECAPNKCANDFLHIKRARDCQPGEYCCLLLRY